MNILKLISPWIKYSPPKIKTNHPKLIDDYSVGFTDFTGQKVADITNRNVLVVQANCDDSVLQRLLTDSQYKILSIKKIDDITGEVLADDSDNKILDISDISEFLLEKEGKSIQSRPNLTKKDLVEDVIKLIKQ